ncbi:MAG: Ger(x)C family spore germination protein [Bacillota bacterium]
MRKLSCIIICILSVFLTSCADNPNNIVEDIAPSILYYFEKGENEKYQVSTMVPPVKDERRVVLSTEETLLKDVKKKLNYQYFRDVKEGQLRLVFFNEDLAKDEGIREIINVLYMDPAISDRLFLGIVKGDFINLLYQNELTDYFLFKEMKHNEKGGIMTVTNMHQYLKAVHSEFADPYIPYYSMEGEDLHYNGVALMKNHKIVQKLTLLESSLFEILLDNKQYQDVIPLEKLQVSIGIVHNKLKIIMNESNKTVDLKVVLNGIISEYQGERDLSNIKEQKKLKKEITNEIHKQTLGLLKSFQDQKIDPLQLGLFTKRAFSQTYHGNEWEEAWPQYNINLKIDLNIKDYGTYQQEEAEGINKG